ncbi:MAG: M48 family metallopeptidase [Sphingomonas sp.]|uniref:M48 family metallopeptidase n=1 Tax=Sphingomonas sp. TaxID=28214 RepID=UPI000DB89CCD|nr:M48 family metallopeptidase [Sphingomonas sp.]PZP16488.1 MAG: metal-dependent hydrolase [Sphingomonas hengshuiensis]
MTSRSAPAPIAVVRHPRARAVRLRIDPATGEVRLVLPPRASLASAMRWAAEKGAWIAAARAKLPPPRPFLPGAHVPYRGGELEICWRADAPRCVNREGDRLICGGPLDGLAVRITRWLRSEALALLQAETTEFARLGGVEVAQIALGDPRGRWGSCSVRGTIRYSWRLILMPDMVRRAVVAHEVAHRVHMHHGPTFHALVDRLVGRDAGLARHWLRVHGSTLHWVGRSA